ncbi:pyridoxamine 5'-phosphate oxidase family protein [Desulfovermiculus halophilus]|uniref:pyridoxamine 5'-phosphate oxidase family protein n=1 Tax=Desulfovermiculus halophilus TaxID=339722 RepID=UPI0004894DC6|nr:pyridoxamine 5'-phosphate oxidase family protein [Desulfovermiculus halophilus]
MGRDDRYIEESEEIKAVIRRCGVCRLGLARENEPYIVPVCFGFDGHALYIHTGTTGRKIEFFEANPQVCFEFEDNARVIADSDKPCAWSMIYTSVVGSGRIRELHTEDEKVGGLNQIMNHYSGKSWVMPREKLDSVRVWAVDIESMRGKSSAHS